MKKITLAAAFCLLLTTFGCKEVDPSRPDSSKYGSTSGHWGIPVIHFTTAGFNGSPTEQVGEPSNSTADAKK